MSIDPVLFDLRQVLRGLRRRPAYVAAAVATLVLVLAANATLFAAINATLSGPRRSVPVRRQCRWSPGRPACTHQEPQPAACRGPGRLPTQRPHSARRQRVRPAGSHADRRDRPADGARRGGECQPVPLVADRPQLGRAFTGDEEEHGARLVVFTHNLWRSRFGQDRAVLGRTLELDGSRTPSSA